MRRIFWFWFPTTVLRKPSNLLHFLVTLDTCSFQVRSVDIWTPRRRRLVAVESFVLETKYSGDGLFLRRPIHITWHFWGFSWSALFSDHQWRVAKSFWRNWTSESSLITRKRKVSSAYWKILERRWRWRSLTQILKSRGPSTEPWGTPERTGTKSDILPRKTTLWWRFEINEEIQFSRGPLKPYVRCNFSNETWDMESKARL